MPNALIKQIADDLRAVNSSVLIVENNDGFLYRKDLLSFLEAFSIKISSGSILQQRIDFELQNEDELLVLITSGHNTYLEDISENASFLEFFLKDYLKQYHIPSIENQSLEILNQLFLNPPLSKLNKRETLLVIDKIVSTSEEKARLICERCFEELDGFLVEETINWHSVIKSISKALYVSIGTSLNTQVLSRANVINEKFQDYLKTSYKQLKNSSSYKRPMIVSKVLDYLKLNFSDDKIALVVIDGMAWWQYQMLKEKIKSKSKERSIHAWIPSITQLSRQAIFRGDSPKNSYRQNPDNERRLWEEYWINNGVGKYQIRYGYDLSTIENLDQTTRLALVYKDLDEKMHGSTSDYLDLKSLTENWIERSGIVNMINDVRSAGFKIFITTDHGNIQATGWRGLKGKEKLGTQKSGSRGQRHLEYEQQSLSDDFISSNPELQGAIVQDDQAIYFTNNQSFSTKETLVTHGGSHMLEVLIPFVEI